MPGTDQLRPVVQAEDYGKRLGQVTLTFDPATGTVTAADAELVDVVGVAAGPGGRRRSWRTAKIRRRGAGPAAARLDHRGHHAGVQRPATRTGARSRCSATSSPTCSSPAPGTPGRGGAQIAFMNPGGLRADLLYAPDGVVTYAEAFAVQPFANDVVTQDATPVPRSSRCWRSSGSRTGASRPVLWLGVSKGFNYTYDPEAPQGSRITSMTLNGTPIDPAGSVPGDGELVPRRRRGQLHHPGRGHRPGRPPATTT